MRTCSIYTGGFFGNILLYEDQSFRLQPSAAFQWSNAKIAGDHTPDLLYKQAEWHSGAAEENSSQHI